MKRRRFVLMGLSALWLSGLRPAHPTQAPLVARLTTLRDPRATVRLRQALARLGYAEGRNIAYEIREALGGADAVANAAAEVVRLRPRVINTAGSLPTRALMKETTTIPIVTNVGDPVGLGFARSLSRPGGNVTGVSRESPERSAKSMELLRQIVPRLSSVPMLYRGVDPEVMHFHGLWKKAGQPYGIDVPPTPVATQHDIGSAFHSFKARGIRAAIVDFPVLQIMPAEALSELAIASNVAMWATATESVAAGLLACYAPDWGLDDVDNYAAVADAIDKILRGTPVSEVPFRMPSRFVLAINAATARRLRLAIPSDILLRADRIFE